MNQPVGHRSLRPTIMGSVSGKVYYFLVPNVLTRYRGAFLEMYDIHIRRKIREMGTWCRLHTVTINTHRNIPAVVTKRPPEKQNIMATLLNPDTLAFHNSGKGMLIR